MQNQLRSELPEPGQPKPLFEIRPPSSNDFSSLHKSALIDLSLASGRAGITGDGKRFFECHPSLLYLIFRFAPIHSYVQAIAVRAAAHELGGGFKTLFDYIISVQRELLSSLSGRPIEQEEDVMKLWGEMVGRGSPHTLPWHLGSWYNS